MINHYASKKQEISRFRESDIAIKLISLFIMKSILNSNYSIHFQEETYLHLNKFIASKQPSCIFILVDENTMDHCYPLLLPYIETVARIEIIEVESGEEHKNIATCSGVWSAMIELGCDRNSLLINLGGGVITDLGGFIASTIKRGISFIHIPTTVLGMVDAAIGGKNGVDIGQLKNQIGVVNPPEMTLIDTNYLVSLEKKQWINGSIEMFKHGLIADREYWNEMIQTGDDYLSEKFTSLIYQSIVIKDHIVKSDPFEKGPRKSLNYGHTIGHAIESFCLSSKNHEPLLHGEAIAVGLFLESYLSYVHTGLNKNDFDQIASWYHQLGFQLEFTLTEIEEMLELMSHDKKNVNGEIRFVLLPSIGFFVTDQTVPVEDVIKSFSLL
ncbi:3-dehydroquinate synthase [Nonlabens sp.]|uniref:3-dehydroquinate synthase n=1 Tax=Nonlabens sp. TaxID=1888209 RepID=UPI00345C9FF8